jgi:hypothetical protein
MSLTNHQDYLDYKTGQALGMGKSIKSNIQLRRVLSGSKFPDNIEIIHEYPNTKAYEPRGYGEYREIVHIVLSSFGSYYDSQALNKGQKTISGSEVRISDALANQNYHSPNRVWSGIRSVVVNTGRKLSGAHFYVDRLGNLIVMGDVDMIMIGSIPCSSSAIFVALEESIYVPTTEWYKTRPTPCAIILGDDRNVVSDGYTEAQYNTLAVLLRKLEMAFPEIVGGGGGGDFTAVMNRAVTLPVAEQDGIAIKKITSGDTPGYITDAWPNFTTEEEWQDLFENYVDPQEQIGDDDIWKGSTSYLIPEFEHIAEGTSEVNPSNAYRALERVPQIVKEGFEKKRMSESFAAECQKEIIAVQEQISGAAIQESLKETEGLTYTITEEEMEEDPTCCSDWEDT